MKIPFHFSYSPEFIKFQVLSENKRAKFIDLATTRDLLKNRKLTHTLTIYSKRGQENWNNEIMQINENKQQQNNNLKSLTSSSGRPSGRAAVGM